MKKLKLYLDTSVFNFALTENPILALYKKATNDLLEDIKHNKYHAFISAQVFIEINRASEEEIKALNFLITSIDIEELPINEEVENLADRYILEKLIPLKYRADALHIAVASINEMDIVISWNFKHMVNWKTKHGVIAINSLLGYKPIEILSPEEV